MIYMCPCGAFSEDGAVPNAYAIWQCERCRSGPAKAEIPDWDAEDARKLARLEHRRPDPGVHRMMGRARRRCGLRRDA